MQEITTFMHSPHTTCTHTDMHSSHREVQELRLSIPAVSPGPGLRSSGGRVKEELVVLQRVYGARNVADKSLGFVDCHGPREATTLQEESRERLSG